MRAYEPSESHEHEQTLFFSYLFVYLFTLYCYCKYTLRIIRYTIDGTHTIAKDSVRGPTIFSGVFFFFFNKSYRRPVRYYFIFSRLTSYLCRMFVSFLFHHRWVSHKERLKEISYTRGGRGSLQNSCNFTPLSDAMFSVELKES